MIQNSSKAHIQKFSLPSLVRIPYYILRSPTMYKCIITIVHSRVIFNSVHFGHLQEQLYKCGDLHTLEDFILLIAVVFDKQQNKINLRTWPSVDLLRQLTCFDLFNFLQILGNTGSSVDGRLHIGILGILLDHLVERIYLFRFGCTKRGHSYAIVSLCWVLVLILNILYLCVVYLKNRNQVSFISFTFFIIYIQIFEKNIYIY